MQGMRPLPLNITDSTAGYRADVASRPFTDSPTSKPRVETHGYPWFVAVRHRKTLSCRTRLASSLRSNGSSLGCATNGEPR